MTIEDAQQELKKAYLRMEEGQVERAIELCESASTLAPESPLPPTLAASFYLAIGDHTTALKRLRAVLRRWPTFALAHAYVAEVHLLNGRRKPGWDALEKAEANDDGALNEHLALLRSTFEPLTKNDIPAPLVVDRER